MFWIAPMGIDAKAEANRILAGLGLSGTPISEERLNSSTPQTRILYRDYEIILQDDRRYTAFRNPGSVARRRALYEKGAKVTLTAENQKRLIARARVIQAKLTGTAQWQEGFRAASSRRSRMYGEGWGAATVTYAQTAYGYKTNGCGNSLILRFDQSDLSVAGMTLRSGWTYRKPKIKISRQKAIDLSAKQLRFKTAPIMVELAYAVPTWAFGKDHRRNNFECVLAYTCTWKGGMATVDAETGEFIAGSRLF